MCDDSDLGRQNPVGCRYIYGDPGVEGWHYCQRNIAPGGKPGSVTNPPYCDRHTRVCRVIGRAYSERSFAWADRDVLFQSAWAALAEGEAVPLDIQLQLNRTGAFSHD